MIVLIIVLVLVGGFVLFMLSGKPVIKAGKKLNEEFKTDFKSTDEQMSKVDWTKTTDNVKKIFDNE